MNTIKILGSSGDKTFAYNPETQMEEATARFEQLKNSGYTLFGVDPETKDTTLVDTLFKEQVQVVAVPRISGG